MNQHGYGCHRSLTLRDTPKWNRLAATSPLALQALPAFVDLAVEPFMPPIRDQGPLGSCTAFAATGLYEFVYRKLGYHNEFEPAELFQYYNERLLMNTVNSDSGATITTAIQALEQFGVPAEHWWPYNPMLYTTQPPSGAYANALRHRTTQALTVPQDLPSLKQCLAEGWPIDVGFIVYESFESPQAMSIGVVPMPSPGEAVLGGHSVLLVGYDDSAQLFKFRNQWGVSYGKDGYGWFPYAYMTDPSLAFDMHTAREVH